MKRYVHADCPVWLADGKRLVAISSMPFTCRHCLQPAVDTPQDYPSPARSIAVSIAVFIAAWLIAALLSIDDIDGRRPGTTEVEHR